MATWAQSLGGTQGGARDQMVAVGSWLGATLVAASLLVAPGCRHHSGTVEARAGAGGAPATGGAAGRSSGGHGEFVGAAGTMGGAERASGGASPVAGTGSDAVGGSANDGGSAGRATTAGGAGAEQSHPKGGATAQSGAGGVATQGGEGGVPLGVGGTNSIAGSAGETGSAGTLVPTGPSRCASGSLNPDPPLVDDRPPSAPAIELISPADDFLINAESLRVTFAVAGVAGGSERFTLGEQQVTGSPALNVTGVRIALDGTDVYSTGTPPCAIAVFQHDVDLSAADPSVEHTLVLIVEAGPLQTAREIRFWIEPALAPTQHSPVDALAVPELFECVEGTVETTATGYHVHAELSVRAGSVVDLAAHGFALTFGFSSYWVPPENIAIEPELDNCTVEFSDPTVDGARLQFVRGRWHLDVDLNSTLPRIPGYARIYSLGGVGDALLLTPGRALEAVHMKDPHQARRALIGPEGGELTAENSLGTRYVLTVPEGALPSETLIVMTPTIFPGVDQWADLERSVVLAPEGLTFSIPATLSQEPSEPFPEDEFPYLVTSMMSRQLTGTRTEPGSFVTELWHFSEYGDGATNAAAQQEIQQARAMVQHLLSLGRPLRYPIEVNFLNLAVATLQRYGEENFDLATIVARVERALRAHLDSICPPALEHPSQDALRALGRLEVQAQRWDVAIPEILECHREVLRRGGPCLACRREQVCVDHTRCCIPVGCRAGNCGYISNGCGRKNWCGTCRGEPNPDCAEGTLACGDGERCNLGTGQCEPKRCTDGSLTCADTQYCDPFTGQCLECERPDCAFKHCGDFTTDCGETYNCGGCPDGWVCGTPPRPSTQVTECLCIDPAACP